MVALGGRVQGLVLRVPVARSPVRYMGCCMQSGPGWHLPTNRWPPQLRLEVCQLRLGVSRLRLAPELDPEFRKFNHLTQQRGSLSSNMKACDSHSTFRALSNARPLKYTFTSFLARYFDNLFRASVCTRP